MKKGALFGLLVVALVALSLFGACAEPAPAPPPTPAPAPAPAPPPAPETVKLGFVHLFPPTHYAAADQFPSYFKMVEGATGGKYILDIEYYPVGTLLGGAEI